MSWSASPSVFCRVISPRRTAARFLRAVCLASICFWTSAWNLASSSADAAVAVRFVLSAYVTRASTRSAPRFLNQDFGARKSRAWLSSAWRASSLAAAARAALRFWKASRLAADASSAGFFAFVGTSSR